MIHLERDRMLCWDDHFIQESHGLSIDMNKPTAREPAIHCDAEGNPLEGYAALDLFGDSVNRKLRFEKELAPLNGRPLRMKFRLRDCALYSFKFNQKINGC